MTYVCEDCGRIADVQWRELQPPTTTSLKCGSNHKWSVITTAKSQRARDAVAKYRQRHNA